MGGGTFDDRNFVIDVYGIPVPTGVYGFLYNRGDGAWYSISWVFHGTFATSSGTAYRFGVSTKWAYANPAWKVYAWRYVYSC